VPELPLLDAAVVPELPPPEPELVPLELPVVPELAVPELPEALELVLEAEPVEPVWPPVALEVPTPGLEAQQARRQAAVAPRPLPMILSCPAPIHPTYVKAQREGNRPPLIARSTRDRAAVARSRTGRTSRAAAAAGR
jgi:hypothetical protein